MRTLQIPRRFVTHPWGGTETVVLETSKRLNALGHPTEIVTTLAMSDQRVETIEEVVVKRYGRFYPYLGLDQNAVRSLDQKGGNLFSFGLWRALRAESNLDILHLHTGKRLGGIVRHVAQGRQIPYVVSLHGGLLDVPVEESRTWTEPTAGKFEWGKALGAWVGARRVIEDAAAIVCVGRQEAEAVAAKYPDQRVESLPNGVDPEAGRHAHGDRWRAENGIRQDAPLVLVVGRLDPQKDQLTAIHAMEAVRELNPEARLVLIGGVTNDDYVQRLKSEAEGNALVIPGYPRGDRRLWDAYAAADVVVVPSRHEPFGIVVLEAWAMSKPVVVSEVGGLGDLVAHGEDGLKVTPGDINGFSDAIIALLKNRERAREMGAAGRRKVLQSYTWDAVTRRLVALYEEVKRAHPVRS